MEQQTYFLRLYDISFPVSREQYQDYYKEQNRWAYLQKLDGKHKLVYYYALDTDEYTGEEILEDTALSVEDMVEQKLLLEQLTSSMAQLLPEEKMLVEELFLKGRTERELGTSIGIPQKTINNRKRKVLLKLRALIEGTFQGNIVA